MKWILHALEWRVIAFVADIVIVYAVTGSWKLSGALASISTITKTIIHAGWLKLRNK